ncbi:hypothetical protein D9615_008433 [Tricholomella constricta]|uniref:Integrase catalytic domain-containing protein n=1 Tax=Tricholomella constricta TaxID=117010 RepID=A0A8H5M5C6_9AGAR|nr:hypothetical protein D9615_008433 [Tricholomella constricta]
MTNRKPSRKMSTDRPLPFPPRTSSRQSDSFRQTSSHISFGSHHPSQQDTMPLSRSKEEVPALQSNVPHVRASRNVSESVQPINSQQPPPLEHHQQTAYHPTAYPALSTHIPTASHPNLASLPSNGTHTFTPLAQYYLPPPMHSAQPGGVPHPSYYYNPMPTVSAPPQYTVPNAPLAPAHYNLQNPYGVPNPPAAPMPPPALHPPPVPNPPLVANPGPTPSRHVPAPPRTPLPRPPSRTASSPDHEDTRLPNTAHIPLLTGKHDWGPWSSAVELTLDNLYLTDHISDPPAPGSPWDPSLIPSYPPIVDRLSTADEIRAWRYWWQRDGQARHILLSRLSGTVQNSLPGFGRVSGVKLPARDILAKLRLLYGIGDWTSAQVIKTRLRNLSYGSNRVLEFITAWRNGINQLESAGFPWDLRDGLSAFLDRFPFANHHLVELSAYRKLLRSPVSSLPPYNTVFQDFQDVEINYQRLHPRPRPQPNNSTPRQSFNTNPSQLPATTASLSPPPPSSSNPAPRTRPVVPNTNPNQGWRSNIGPSGGAQQRPTQALLADGQDQSVDPGVEGEDDYTTIPPCDPDPPLLDTAPPSVFAGISVAASPNTMFFDAYFPLRHDQPQATTDPLALISYSQPYNCLLDSGCSSHIFNKREVFWSYDTSTATSVLTANSGSLDALARGEVRLRVNCIDGNSVVLCLRDCLHAPSCPINLLSVGSLTNRGIEFDWRPGAHTFLRFPKDHPAFANSTFLADVFHHLSFLRCEFIYPDKTTPSLIATPPATPTPSLPPVAAPVFERIRETPELWHRRLGHIGLDATRAVLLKDYATGVKWEGTFEHTHCIPCLIGKYPQRPYTHNQHRASQTCELLHIDTCSPFPVATPQKQRYFFSILDDYSNWGLTDLMAHKNEAFMIYKTTEAAWELQSGNRVRAIRCDGAKEFILGKFASHLRSRGIQHQITAEYAHQQNGKIERYIRTIEDGAQAMLADARLPPSFLGDAILTYQYLLNRTPTSTLPLNVTPHEAFRSTKPDLSHLRVWGCQCFVAIPPELRTKGGPRRFEAIFVGYTEGREGWRVRDLNGRYHFTRDAIFNESTPGHVVPSRGKDFPEPVPLPSYLPPPPSPRSQRTTKPTDKGLAYQEAIKAKNNRTKTPRANLTAESTPGLSPTMLNDFVSFTSAEDFIVPDSYSSLVDSEARVLHEYCMGATTASSKFYQSRNFDLNKAPESQREATPRT